MSLKNIKNVLAVLRLAERLKMELRHSWLSDGRQESVAEHSWRLALMVLLLEPELDRPIDTLKALKIALIHDLVEAEVGDIPVFELDELGLLHKQQQEQLAIENIRQQLASDLGDELYELWQEFEAAESYEAKLVNALDKLECKLQHIEADLSTWNDKERAISFDWQDGLYDFDSTIVALRDDLKRQSVLKVAAG